MDERWRRVKEIFDAVADRPLAERATLLDQRCGDDLALRGEVESLLRSDAEADGFIEDAIAELPRDLLDQTSGDEAIGRQFGAYRILREIGRGGLGTVYLAERADEQYEKQVAIKLVRRGLDTDDILRRFRSERQILAQLEHPNIGRLLDAGTSDEGLPYFVMEYVQGEPIVAYCDNRGLDAPERLELFRKVCAAVTYAHQHLVIHRDLKPSNILVTPEGEPKLLDFGIAKVLSGGDDQLFTQTMPAMRVMTPEYASPEQVKGGNITTTSDVYSLGVLLFELLTGQRPYRLTTHTPDELSHAITEQEPTRPSIAIRNQNSEIRIQKSLRGDLDNIVLMALRKEPVRRYSSVGQFSEDIRRHLVGLPVIARRDTWSYRSGKFVQRHKVGVAAASIVLLAICAGLVSTLREKNRAERRFNDVRHLANALLVDIAPKIERLPGATEARQVILSQSLKYLDSLAKEAGNDRNLQAELAGAYEKVGDLQGNPTNANLTALTDALASYQKANAMRRRLLDNNPRGVEERSRLANNYKMLGDIYWQTGESAQSLKNSEEALRFIRTC